MLNMPKIVKKYLMLLKLLGGYPQKCTSAQVLKFNDVLNFIGRIIQIFNQIYYRILSSYMQNILLFELICKKKKLYIKPTFLIFWPYCFILSLVHHLFPLPKFLARTKVHKRNANHLHQTISVYLLMLRDSFCHRHTVAKYHLYI